MKSKRKRWPRNLRLAYLRQIPRRKKMHGGFLHRVLGERLFDPRLWKPTRSTFAGGLALGLLIGLLPTFYIQLPLAFLFAFFVKLNITAAVLGTVVTNPLTTPAIVVLQYKLGVWLVGQRTPEELSEYTGTMRRVMEYAWPFMVGSLSSALIASLIGYVAVLTFWEGTVKLDKKLLHIRHKPSGNP